MNIWKISHRKSYMKTWYSLKSLNFINLSFMNFWVQNVSITPIHILLVYLKERDPNCKVNSNWEPPKNLSKSRDFWLSHKQSHTLVFFWKQNLPNKLIIDALRNLVPFCNLKKVKNTHEGVILLIKMQASAKKVSLLCGLSSRFVNCTNGSKSHKASQTLID